MVIYLITNRTISVGLVQIIGSMMKLTNYERKLRKNLRKLKKRPVPKPISESKEHLNLTTRVNQYDAAKQYALIGWEY